jgi:periplasmic divalent cation tolerance protein
MASAGFSRQGSNHASLLPHECGVPQQGLGAPGFALPPNSLDPLAHSALLGAMKLAGRCKLVLVTAPDRKTARALAGAALKARLIACANLLPGIESHYWWQGKIEHGREVLLMMKTTASCLPKLQKLIIARHPYDTPEFIALALNGGNRRYLNWLAGSCQPL